MNTEQLKTGSESIAKKIISVPDNKPEHSADHKLREITEIVYYFASQESKRAVDEFKEKLKELIRNEMKPEIVGGHRFHREPDFLFGCEKCLDLIDKL